ncbi:HTH domain-containing protein [Carboxylicivirga linearis]|uniref:HTH domain-containing protein n=1 Tax=Carboxylicivirga linearis TaxID=1628157 RepID=A0ABS5JPH3_9BACT|nr:HTH domain-containing protein [Carboxylicivirga linearis]MBS2096787.1 HTH domain-containing protein [Carboxylicivirga linearis]
MSKLTKTIQLMERIDCLIKRKATGTPNELAERLQISKASLHRVLDVMKEFGAPIEYSVLSQSYIYTSQVSFYCGFYTKELQENDLLKVSGGYTLLTNLSEINLVSLKK